VSFRPGGDSRPIPVAATPSPEHRREPVTRRYRPESVAIDELVEVLYLLLTDVPATESAHGGSTCFPVAYK
jgi:hypothetical protein